MARVRPPGEPSESDPPSPRGRPPSISEVKAKASELQRDCFEFIKKKSLSIKDFDIVADAQEATNCLDVATFKVKEVKESKRQALSRSDIRYIQSYIRKKRNFIGLKFLDPESAIERIAETRKDKRNQSENEIRDVVACVISGTVELSSGKNYEVEFQVFMTEKIDKQEKNLCNLLSGKIQDEVGKIKNCELSENSLLGTNEELAREFLERFSSNFVLFPRQ